MRINWVVILMFLWTSGCSKFQANAKQEIDQSFFSSGGGDLIPASDKMASDCATRSEFDGCIYLKSPVAQKQGAVTVGDLESQRQFGVKIRGLSTTGYLENAHFQILTLHTPRFSLFARENLKAPLSDDKSYAEQVSAYYWANRVFEYLASRVGEENLPVTALKIYVDDVFTGYSSRNRSLHLEKRAGQTSKALSADVVIQLLGQALASDLSGKSVFDLSTTAKHNFCSLSPKGCCSADVGCANALGGSAGDYLAAVIFPGRPMLGETFAGAVTGQSICGLDRDLSKLNTKTKAQIYAACTKAPGYAVLMGSWYASLWWKIRTQAEAQETGGSATIDRLFLLHAKSWTAASTFSDAKAKALELAGQTDGGKYLSLFQATFTAAGI
jgi:hypothetical protein